MFEIHN